MASHQAQFCSLRLCQPHHKGRTCNSCKPQTHPGTS
uniref:Uncharacterized protein n=1 Tax=Arundo donax TaxID=35708 RepID=A0A0A9EEK1_ARUDO